MLKTAISLAACLLLYSCAQDKPSGITDSAVADTAAIVNDTKNKLNVQTRSFSEIDSSGILLFPLSMGETGSKVGRLSYKEIPGNSYWNIIFYNSNDSSYHLLGEKKMLVNSYDVSSSKNGNAGVMISKGQIFYKVIIDDYNQDKKLNDEDPEYLFMSDKEGKNFKQLSPAGYHLNSWQFIHGTNKIVMILTADTDKNKIFDDNDEVSSFQIDIQSQQTATPIFSPEFKNKLKVMFNRDWKKPTG
jgi:hypothetical protein